MSCENPEGQDEVMPRKRRFDKSSNCIKCKDVRGSIVVRHAVYCKACFLALALAKFRKCIQPPLETFPPLPPTQVNTAPVKPERAAIIAYSGGIGSATLLDIFHQNYFATGKTKGGNKRKEIWKKVYVCYVETCGVFPEAPDRTEEVRKYADKYKGFEFVPMKLEQAFDSAWWSSVGGVQEYPIGIDLTSSGLPVINPASTTPVAALRAFMTSLPTSTARTTAIQTLIRLLLLHIANTTHSTHLLFGTSLTTFSVSLISSISQGAGFVVRELREEIWREKVCVVRPLREMSSKECAAWCRWSNVDIIPGGVMTSHEEGIEKITKDFIIGLEKDYPSTVSTVTRTCGKLVPKGDSIGLCPLCERPAQSGVLEWKARISVNGNTAFPIHPSTTNEASRSQPHHLGLQLCYACHTTFTSRSSRAPKGLTFDAVLPVWVGEHMQNEGEEAIKGSIPVEEQVGHVLNPDEVKAQIEDFLLNDDS